MPLSDGAAEVGERSAFFKLRDRVERASPVMVRRAGLVERWQWVGLFALALAALAGAALAGGLVSMGAEPGAARDRLRWPIRLGVGGAVLMAGVARLGLPEALFSPVRAGAVVVLIAGAVGAAFVAINATTRALLRRSAQTDRVFDDILVSLTAGVVKIVVAVAGLLFAADALALPYQSVVAGIGIGGLAFAIAAQDTVANFFGSAVIMADRPFRKGDLLRVQGTEGVVEHVGLRSTHLRTADDSVVVIPNGQLAKETVDNRGLRRARRVEVVVGATYDTSPETLEAFAERLVEAARPHSVEGREPTVGVWAFGASSIDVRLVCFLDARTLDEEQAARHRLLLDVMRLAEAMGVEFAFPTQTLHVSPAPAEPGGDGVPGISAPAVP